MTIVCFQRKMNLEWVGADGNGLYSTLRCLLLQILLCISNSDELNIVVCVGIMEVWCLEYKVLDLDHQFGV